MIYTLDSKDALNDDRKALNSNNKYIKFYKNGRCLILSIPIKDVLVDLISLKIEDLSPNNNYNKKYFYNSNGKDIQIEGFAYGAGQGHYVISNYTINNVGDSLIYENGAFKIVYKKEKIPVNWNNAYGIDW